MPLRDVVRSRTGPDRLGRAVRLGRRWHMLGGAAGRVRDGVGTWACPLPCWPTSARRRDAPRRRCSRCRRTKGSDGAWAGRRSPRSARSPGSQQGDVRVGSGRSRSRVPAGEGERERTRDLPAPVVDRGAVGVGPSIDEEELMREIGVVGLGVVGGALKEALESTGVVVVGATTRTSGWERPNDWRLARWCSCASRRRRRPRGSSTLRPFGRPCAT